MARLEPAFAPVTQKIAGAIRDLGDSSGDSRLFTERLREQPDKHDVLEVRASDAPTEAVLEVVDA